MFRSRSWFGGGWGRPKNPHSLEHLKYLYNVLSRNHTVSEHNRGLLVETLRSIAEILIWGDQNDSSVFDFFLEKNMLSFFLRIMRQRSGGSSYVCVQLLQTLNILFENIRNETSLYYLLSNNHVNSIIVHKFDFSDEEVMAYYISFLKTLSLKLNDHTIHFFYNEHTNDFPLYTEAIKFFNHPESMVRIAVRTLTLNVYKVENTSMLGFIRDCTAAPYFSNIVWFIGKHVQELDSCVRNEADHTSHNRLADLVAEHLDHLHYLNDILCLNISDLNQVLTDHLLNKLLIPLYICSLTKRAAAVLNLPEQSTTGRVSSVLALFLLSQVCLILNHAPLVESLARIILKTNDGDGQDDSYKEEDVGDGRKTSVNVTDEEKEMLATAIDSDIQSPFLKMVYESLDCVENDYSALFALSLLYAMAFNRGISADVVDLNLRPKKLDTKEQNRYLYNTLLVDKLLTITLTACQATSRIRLVTLELALKLLLQLVVYEGRSVIQPDHMKSVEGAKGQSTAMLRNFYKSEEIFLDMFEHEYWDMSRSSMNVEWLCMDSAILLPPTGTPMTGIDFTKRLPCGEVERARRAIRVFFLVRNVVQYLNGDVETQLPLTNPQSCVQIEQALDLNNSDLIACTVLWKDGTKTRRFLVIDVLQLILVEPDTKRLGWGVAKLVGFLQDIEVTGDKDDSRCLHVTIHRPLSGTLTNRVPLLNAKFLFDDNIRCMAAKQRLTKGRLKARQKKMQQIARLLEIPGQSGPPSPAFAGMGPPSSNTCSSASASAQSRSSRTIRDQRAFHLSKSPGFAAPRWESPPGVTHRANQMIKEKENRLKGQNNGSSRESSATRSKSSREGSPRMPRPKSEEIPLGVMMRKTPQDGAVGGGSTNAHAQLGNVKSALKEMKEEEDGVGGGVGSVAGESRTTTQEGTETSFIMDNDKKEAVETV